jgi:hypothetical protein
VLLLVIFIKTGEVKMKLFIFFTTLMLSAGAYASDESIGTLEFAPMDHRGGYCEANLVARNGRILAQFQADTCRDAMWYCQNDLEQRHREGRNPYAQCVIDNGGNGNYPPPHRPPHRPPPHQPPYNPPNYGSFVCVANDNGWEEHNGGHSGYGRTQWEAERSALEICRQQHGDCYISSCRQGY